MRDHLRCMLEFTFAPERAWQAAAGAATQASAARYLALVALLPACVAALLTIVEGDAAPFAVASPLAPGSPYSAALGDAFGLPAVGVSAIAERASVLVAAVVAVLAYFGTWTALACGTVVLRVLAPVFRGRADMPRCFSVVVYSATPLLLSSVALLNPSLTPVIALAAMHACYVAYLGVTPLLSVPRSDAGVYVAVAVLTSLVLSQAAGYGAGSLASVLCG